MDENVWEKGSIGEEILGNLLGYPSEGAVILQQKILQHKTKKNVFIMGFLLREAAASNIIVYGFSRVPK